jgi:hypothetical protein
MDLGKSFSYVFEDEKWIETILIGGLILIIPIIGQLYLLGFMIEAARRVVAGQADLLPEWGDVAKKIEDGLKVFVITFVYALPAILIALFLGIIFAGTGWLSYVSNTDSVQTFGLLLGVFASFCLVPLMVLLGIVLQILSYAGLMIYVRTGKVGDALHFGEAYDHVQGHIGNYLILWLVFLLASFVGSLGSIFFGVGALFTGIYSQAQFGNYFGQFINAERQFRDRHPESAS